MLGMSNAQILPVPAVNAVIINEHKEVLLTRRSMQIREPGKWCLPGGHVEHGEKLLEALCREVAEEVGLEVRKAELLGIYSDPKITVTPEPYYDGRFGQFVAATFLVKEFVGQIKTNFEVDDWDWFTADNIPDPILRSHPIRVLDAFRFQGVPFVR